MKLGIFDSGIGGQAIAQALQKHFPKAKIIAINDTRNVPYGDKTPSEVIRLTDAAIQPLLSADCDIIILACNTATALAVDPLRSKYPRQRFIGIEPMIKKAVELTKTNVIAVFATPATLQSDRYMKLVQTYATHCTVIEPDCSDWAYMIEQNQINEHHISKIITDVRNQDTDVIILGCTHYHWIKESVSAIAGADCFVLEPSSAIAERVSSLLSEP